MKKSNSITLVIAPLIGTLLACGGGESTTRDVYASREDCLKDWNEAELCEQMNDDDDREYRSSGGVYTSRPFYGPVYYPSDRAIVYKGRTIAPTGKSTTLKSYTITSRSSSSSRSSTVSSPRSGFGGRSTSGG
ncbi:MAG TPA: hypothetical protein VIL74_11140 [Pyrinomonadaceae bacterium]|jgi:uncharacterized protein YgiB involved in biofilm formation